jgi:hypothetical protein
VKQKLGLQPDKYQINIMRSGIQNVERSSKTNVREFKWTNAIIANVGHDNQKMSNVAANY